MHLNTPVSIFSLEWDLLLRLMSAAIIGLLLGFDREYRGHAAGLRTHGLICFASAVTTVSVLDLYYRLDGARMDPLRLFEAAGAFIGIVGAGLIVFSKGRLHNITTAAHLWLTAAIGIACGAGQWPLAAIGLVFGLVMMTILRLFEDKDGERQLGTQDEQADATRN